MPIIPCDFRNWICVTSCTRWSSSWSCFL